MTDQQSATAMSCVGNEDLHTPNMDRLAKHGIRFENAYCSFPLSGPSRSSMFTGCTPGEMGIRKMGFRCPIHCAYVHWVHCWKRPVIEPLMQANGMPIPIHCRVSMLSDLRTYMNTMIMDWLKWLWSFKTQT